MTEPHDDGGPPAPAPPAHQRFELVIGWRALLPVAAVAAAIALALLSIGTLLAIFLAMVLALGLDPIVDAMETRGWGRGKAAVAVFGGLLLGLALIVPLAAVPVWREVVDFVHAIPEYWDTLSAKPGFQDVLSDSTNEHVRGVLTDLAKGFPEAASSLLGVAGNVVGTFLSLVTLAFLALFLLMERPSIVDWLFGFVQPPTEARWRPVVDDSIRAISSSLLGNVAISLVAGTVAGLSAWALGLPFPIVLAVITGLLDLIPQVGATIAGVILTAVALTVGTVPAVIMAIIQLIYQQIENYVVYPIVYRRAVKLSAFTTIGAVLIASSLLGVPGAILAMPFAAVIKVIVGAAAAPRRDRMAALRTAPTAPTPPPTEVTAEA